MALELHPEAGMQTRRSENTPRREPERLHEYRGRESYEEQSRSGRGGRSAAFPQRDYPRYTERHPAPLDYAGDDDYSRTDYGPLGYGARRRADSERMRDNQRFVNGAYAPGAQPRAPKGYRRSDARIHEEVCERLGRAHGLDVSEVEVEVQEGEVKLSGTVADRAQKRRAEDLAAEIAGVLDVHNGLRLRRAGEG